MLWLSLLAVAVSGYGMMRNLAASNTILQTIVSDEMRGRVMALFAVVFVGSTPIGGPLVGWIAERFGPRVSLMVGASATLLVGLAGWGVLRRARQRVRRSRSEALTEPDLMATVPR